jgi:hypothetical protein
MQRRIAKWAGQLKDVDASLVRKLIQGLKNPNVQKAVIKFLRRMATFVPYIGHIKNHILHIRLVHWRLLERRERACSSEQLA